MNWLKKKIAKWVREAQQDAYEASHVSLKAGTDISTPDSDPVLTFRIFSANNGKVLEFRKYDNKADRSYVSTYIIEKDKDIGEYVNKCLSLEMLK